MNQEPTSHRLIKGKKIEIRICFPPKFEGFRLISKFFLPQALPLHFLSTNAFDQQSPVVDMSVTEYALSPPPFKYLAMLFSNSKCGTLCNM